MELTREMKELADNIGRYVTERFLKPKLASSVSFFIGKVQTAPSAGVVVVQRPFDSTSYSLPYVSSASSLSVGDKCMVFVFGSMSNAIVMGDGRLSNL